MARKDEAVSWLKSGKSPSEIARAMGISVSSVEQYLYIKIVEGALRRSDILFSINPDVRRTIEALINKTGKTEATALFYAAKKEGHSLDRDDLRIYLQLRDARVSLGDMYEFISEIEVGLHQSIKDTLVSEYGPEESCWWRKGVPIEVRKECARMHEEATEPAEELFCYTTFINLKKILDDQWAVFSQVLPEPVVKDAKEKRKFLSTIARLNSIRNCVMHPVKGLKVTEDDFALVREFREQIQMQNWRKRK